MLLSIRFCLTVLRHMAFNFLTAGISKLMKLSFQPAPTGSAQILLRSGIGPQNQLAELAIPLVAELPVGENLVEHPFYYNAYAADPKTIGRQTPVIAAKIWTKSSFAKDGELDLHITATHLLPPD